MSGHPLPNVTVNSFLEDTAVLVASAFLIVRGPLERMLANPMLSGVAFGLISASEAIFPNARFPYASHTLGCAFITSIIGLRAGLISATVGMLAFVLLTPNSFSTVAGVQLGITVLIVSFFPKVPGFAEARGIVSVAAAQTASVAAAQVFPDYHASLTSGWTIPANTFGVVLLGLVIRDARTRSQVEVHKQEVAEARTLAVERELLTLRGRVHPHFLYNALTSIAALCEIAPQRASKAAINLGALMRQSLERTQRETHPLSQEMEVVMNYAQIEMERFGNKVSVHVNIAGCEDLQVPPFAVQILVENAILHGLSTTRQGGNVVVSVKKKAKFAYVAVADDGCGLPHGKWKHENLHGLNILEALMSANRLPGGRLRLMRRPERGTIAVLRVPLIKDAHE